MPGGLGVRWIYWPSAVACAGWNGSLAGLLESFKHASHFEIAPTVRQLLGYPRQPVMAKFGPSLFDANREAAAFTSGDVFGLFSSKVRWHSVDLMAAAARMAHAQAKAESHQAAPTN